MVNIWVVLLVSAAAVMVFLTILYWVIRSAVLSALRTHTLNSVTAVTILEDETR